MTTTRAVDPSVSRDPLPLDAKDLPNVCVLCSHNCAIRVDVEDGRIAKVRPDESSPITQGYVCNKAFSVTRYVEHAQRLEHPLRRKPDGSFERISWDTAISEIAEKLSSIREEFGPRAIGLVGIGGQANHMDGAFGLAWLEALGSKRWYNAFAQEKTQHFLVSSLMFDASPTVFFHPDLEHAKHLLVMGTNPRISNRGHNPNDTFRRLAEDSECRVVVIDPRETETTRQADDHVCIAPGTDAYLLLAMAAAITSGEGLVDAKFVRDHSVDFEALRAELENVDLVEMSRRCEVPVEKILELARSYASADSAAIMWDLAVEQLPFSTLISYLIHAIAAMTGNVGKPGGNSWMESIAPPSLHPNRFDEPERAVASGIRSIASIGGLPMFSPSLVPEEVLIDHPERMRAMVVEASNPLLSYSDTSRWREACEALDLMVVIETAMTESAQLADYVLPAPVGYEKWEMALFPKGYPEVMVQVRPPVVPGPEEALPEPEIYTRLAEAMGIVPPMPDGLAALAENALEPEGAGALLLSAMQAANGMRAPLVFWSYRTVGEHLPAPSLAGVWALCHENAMARRDSVLRTLGDEWKDASPFEIGTELFRRILDHPEGVEIARVDPATNFEDNVGWEDGRVRMAPAELLAEVGRAIENDLPRDPAYPLVLAAGLRTRWTANTIQRHPEWRKGKGPHCPLHLSLADAESLGIASGDAVRISTRRGALELPAEVDAKVRTGHVWIPNGFGSRYPKNGNGELEEIGVNTNELTDASDRDPISGCPHHKYTLCRVERIG